jgi:hypothetical protein
MVLIDSDIKPRINKAKPRLIFKWKKADWASIKEDTKKFSAKFLENWEDCDIDTNWNKVKSHLTTSMNNNIPSSMSRTHQDLPWLTNMLRRQKRKKHKLYAKAKLTNSTADWTKYKQHKKDTKKAINKSHWMYVHGMLQDSLTQKDSKPFWRYIKSKRQDNTGIAPIKARGKLHSENKEKAELLNKQFQSVFTHEDTSSIPQCTDKSLSDITNLRITTEGVEKILKKSQGWQVIRRR